MFRYITIVLAVVACSSAKPALVAPIAYGAPLFAQAGTSQLDIRNSYNGAYATALGYGAPLAARFSPYAYSAPVAKYASPSIASPYGYATPLARYASALPAAYASPLAASPYAASPYAASPYAAQYAAAYGAPVLL